MTIFQLQINYLDSLLYTLCSLLNSTERIAELRIMNLQQKGLTMRIYEPLASIQRTLEESMLPAAETGFLNLNIIKGIILTHAIMKTLETTGITETPLSKTSGSTHIFKGNEKGSESVLKLIAAGGALPIQGDLLVQQYHLQHLSGFLETQNDEFTASRLNEVTA